MNWFKPYSTLVVGMALGYFALPWAMRNVPGVSSLSFPGKG